MRVWFWFLLESFQAVKSFFLECEITCHILYSDKRKNISFYILSQMLNDRLDCFFFLQIYVHCPLPFLTKQQELFVHQRQGSKTMALRPNLTSYFFYEACKSRMVFIF